MGSCLTRCKKCGIDIYTYQELHPNSVYHCREHNLVVRDNKIICKDCYRPHLSSNCRHQWKNYLW